MIKKGQHIRCMFHNSFVVEGVVDEWSDSGAILISLTDESRLIIPNPSRDIMFIKAVLPQQKVPAPQLDQDIEEVRKEPLSDLKNKKLAELKILKSKVDKELIVSKLKSHSINQPRMVQYGTPGFYKK